MYRFLPIVVFALVIGVVSKGQAQRAVQQVLDLNRQAMDNYTNLNLEQAERQLAAALEIAQRENISGAPVARTLVNLAVLAIGGYQDTERGLEYFILAIEAEPNVQLDPLTSTPEIQEAFRQARSHASPSGPTTMAPVGNLPHRPPIEQLAQTALPIFIAAPPDALVGSVMLYYRSTGMRDFRELEMERLRGGFGVEIPCRDVFAPTVSYYIEAIDESGTPLGNAGTAEQPFEVPIVEDRNHPPTALPGRMPPEPCAETECPPGMPGCENRGSAGLGDTCREDEECRPGLACEDNFCVAEDEANEGDDEMPRFFLHIGGSIGGAYVGEGMEADRGPTAEEATASWVEGGEEGCDLEPGLYCVRIEKAGLVRSLALRAEFGYWIIPRFALAATARFQPKAGTGPLSNIMFGLRAQYLATRPSEDGFNASVHVGYMAGQYQVRPPQGANVPEPYVISGLSSVQVGSTLGYRFLRNIGLYVTPEVILMFPTFLFAMDVSAGVAITF